MADPLHLIADSNKGMDEAKRTDQDIRLRRKVQIPEKILLIGGKLTEAARTELNVLLEKYLGLKGSYWAKEKTRGLYQQESQAEAAKIWTISYSTSDPQMMLG